MDWDCMLSELIILNKEGGPKLKYAGKLSCQDCNKSKVNLIKESISGKMLCINCIIQESKSLNKSLSIKKKLQVRRKEKYLLAIQHEK